MTVADLHFHKKKKVVFNWTPLSSTSAFDAIRFIQKSLTVVKHKAQNNNEIVFSMFKAM